MSGMVRLVARMVAKECKYSWQWSGGKTYLFRVRGMARKVSTVWCDPVPFLVK